MSSLLTPELRSTTSTGWSSSGVTASDEPARRSWTITTNPRDASRRAQPDIGNSRSVPGHAWERWTSGNGPRATGT